VLEHDRWCATTASDTMRNESKLVRRERERERGREREGEREREKCQREVATL